ncbi:MAG: hypothetical protein J7L08_00495, partial [Candidatus Aenigmarchaeota archaeon]|nr:hypothetical protein [Candidatus Aenigmarchaeota archaeon]
MIKEQESSKLVFFLVLAMLVASLFPVLALAAPIDSSYVVKGSGATLTINPGTNFSGIVDAGQTVSWVKLNYNVGSQITARVEVDDNLAFSSPNTVEFTIGPESGSESLRYKYNLEHARYARFILTDSSNWNLNEVWFTNSTDLVSPNIDLNYPSPNTFIRGSTIEINGTISDANPESSSSVIVNDTRFGTNEGTYGSWKFTNNTPLSDGYYAVKITANDTAGNKNSTVASFTVDNTPPTCSILSINEGTNSAYQYVSGTTIYYNNNDVTG